MSHRHRDQWRDQWRDQDGDDDWHVPKWSPYLHRPVLHGHHVWPLDSTDV